MTNFKVKFFGSKDTKKQIKRVKINIETQFESNIESILQKSYGYKIIQGLKISNKFIKNEIKKKQLNINPNQI